MKHIVFYKIKACTLAAFIFLTASEANGALVSREEVEPLFGGRHIIADSRYETDGVFISRPGPAWDITNIMKREDIYSVEDYARWLGEHIQYANDGEADEWSSPEATLSRGYGDCEDFAFLTAAFLRVMGYEPKVVGVKSRFMGGGHALCIFKDGDRYCWFDNSNFKESRLSSMEEFTQYLLASYASPALFALSGPSGSTP